MVTPTPLWTAAVAALALVVAYVSYRKGRADGIDIGRERAQRESSREAHDQAVDREPPVSIGDGVSLGIKEFKTHHSGDRVAVCKTEGFVVFVEGVPGHVDAGDVIDATVVSFGPDRNSAEATYDG